jgi:hypothetical protein
MTMMKKITVDGVIRRSRHRNPGKTSADRQLPHIFEQHSGDGPGAPRLQNSGWRDGRSCGSAYVWGEEIDDAADNDPGRRLARWPCAGALQLVKAFSIGLWGRVGPQVEEVRSGGRYLAWLSQHVPKWRFRDGIEVLGKISAIDVAHEVPCGH